MKIILAMLYVSAFLMICMIEEVPVMCIPAAGCIMAILLIWRMINEEDDED